MKASPARSPGTIPVVDLERIGNTYAELKKMEIRLDPNPIEYGPKRFNNRIAQVRTMLTRLEQLFLQTSEDLHYFKRQISKRHALYELEKRDLMINDPKCRVGRSQGEREALADVQLRSEIEQIQKLQIAANDLEALMTVIKSKRTDLKDIQGRMRDQMKLIEHDLGMGARWGSNAPPSTASQSVSEIDDLLAGVDSASGIKDDGTGTPIEDEEDGDEEDGDEEEDSEDSDGEEEEEETEGETEEEDLLSFVEAEDPTPHAEDPVLIFGENEEEPAAPPADDIEKLIPDEDAEGTLPEEHSAQEDADSFLDALDAVDTDEPDTSSEEEATQGIDDLIASLADD